MDSHLQLRLKNCLQTILEMEPDMEDLPEQADFRPDMETLKSYISKVDAMDLVEEDVSRLEYATAHFLAELRLPVERTRTFLSTRRILQ